MRVGDFGTRMHVHAGPLWIKVTVSGGAGKRNGCGMPGVSMETESEKGNKQDLGFSNGSQPCCALLTIPVVLFTEGTGGTTRT
jgi:hypothetical protein